MKPKKPSEQELRSTRQSIIWATVERMAFRPTRSGDTRTWISLYNKTIHNLWELQPGDVAIRYNKELQIPFLRLTCKYNLDEQSVSKYDIRIHPAGDGRRCLWTVHVDPEFTSRAALYNEKRNYPSQDYDAYLNEDVKKVLEGMIFHPRNHAHLEECGLNSLVMPNNQTLQLHEIRIGGGIENAFVFLFHLRYQFCLVSEQTRNQEKDRLIDLFTSAIKRKENIAPDKLFNFKKEVMTCGI